MQYEIEVDIEAAPEAVWAVLTDVERWPSWTESMTRVSRLEDGELGLGSTARVEQPGLPASVWTVTEHEPGRSFSWTSKAAGITTVGGHHILAGPNGTTSVRLTLRQTGPLAPVIGLLLSRRSRRYVDMEAHGLKRRCES
ncbi:SRPBCC family protein [Actinomadura alba]|uniref:SRPBCC family protein n=1 Tax=Actinomadura alba TaxID=406431 RepID=A0ABR7LGP8_9ACTN|nr:SRPBCC family protein [Actinomadura alba]MBC6464001.1 SRPBCC family protein [Actinomadura alba]